MRPLTSGAITGEFMEDCPFLLLDESTFNTRHVGHVLADNALKSKGGISLPEELWQEVFKSLKRKPKYHLVRPLTTTTQGKDTMLHCKVDVSSLNVALACLKNEDQVKGIEYYLDAPNSQHAFSSAEISEDDPRTSPFLDHFSVRLTDSESPSHKKFLPPCLFYQITVPDVIARLQNNKCSICEDRHTICPGCTRGVAQRFDAFMGRCVDLACPLCLGLDFMREDKDLLQVYYDSGLPEEEEKARSRRMEKRLKELGY